MLRHPTIAALALALGLAGLMTASAGCDVPSAAPGDADAPGATDTPQLPDLPPGDTIAGNRPPELARIGDRVVALGEPLVIVAEASDPDGDALTFSVYGKLPAGARFIKPERRLEWTPEALGPPVFLTFVVSDGTDFDRETVRIEVVAEKSAHPPVLAPVGDQAVVAGQPFTLQLQATDPDGDGLTFGHEGALPAGAALDPAKGRFTWTAPAAAVGTTERVTFTVSDGALSDTLEVRFVVTDGATTGPAPPVFAALGPQKVEIGQTLTLKLVATDPNGDALTFAIEGGAPPGGSLAGDVFTYAPAAADAGLVWSVTFSATDGVFEAVTTVKISVLAAPKTADCQDDPGEPNEDAGQATTLTPGTIERSLCDTALVPIDVDWYAIEAPAGQKLQVTLTFDPAEGDLDLYLLGPEQQTLSASETVTGAEVVSHTPSAAQTLYVVVTGVGQESFHMGYALTLSLTTTASCEADDFEPNDDVSEASPLPGPSDVMSICPGDLDVFAVSLACGAKVVATLDTAGTGDLDMGLWPVGAVSGTPLAQAATDKEVETFTVASVPEAGDHVIIVSGYPHGQAEGIYSLEVAVGGGCQDDGLGNGSAAKAKALSDEGGTLGPYALCCGADWFVVPLAKGDELLVDVTLAGGASGTAGIAVFAPDGTTQLASKAPSASGALLSTQAGQAGPHYVRVSGATGTSYLLEWLVEPATAVGCTALSCPVYKVCDAATGTCVSDFCMEDAQCPGGHVCRDTYCVNPCDGDADCRDGYACKGFDVGPHCGIAGDGAPGAACDFHTDCQGSDVCLYPESGGYCATAGCLLFDLACPAGTACSLDADFLDVCGVSCATDAECRQADGFACIPSEDTCLPQ